MPTAPSSAEWRSAVADLRHLLWFRARTSRRRTARIAIATIGVVTAAAVIAPAWWPDRDAAAVARVEGLVPAYLLAIVALCIGSAVASGGGREVLARDAAAVHPVGPFTDHLGALVLAPLSAAWLLQTWCLLGATAWVAGPHPLALVLAEAVALLWVGCATALGQVVGWWVEWLRRGTRGVVVVRAFMAAAALVVGGSVTLARDAIGQLGGLPHPLPVLAVLLVALVALVILGGHAARLAARRPPRDEAHLESRSYPARRAARSDLRAFVRLDRGSVWRSVPVRRGVGFLTIAPGLVALAHPLPWDTLVVLPGLVVSGCVLLFGVNIWALDGRGMLWRETFPVAPSVPLLARGWVLAELLLGAGVLTILLGSIRAERPTAAYLVAAAAALVVVTGQALSGGLRWSARAPQAVDYRSARATPAPPLTMVGYSVRLALATTSTTMVLGALAGLGRTDLVVALSVILVAVSATRLVMVERRWADPQRRSRVVAAVSA
ncbi:hypothetical protein F0U44_07235 [Nocardioides humilatus]|uniref:Uncharacterized protein n=1 Tax=Nocardioides humilatus TaxID=2607660 RepID=A0A5B1LHK7_9ACTN|nr:hypothetical protein [Nocardioides humilatus]KAA1420211.1 hypothetical protein F0U44_07235 [Nocardioides humilatus]